MPLPKEAHHRGYTWVINMGYRAKRKNVNSKNVLGYNIVFMKLKSRMTCAHISQDHECNSYSAAKLHRTSLSWTSLHQEDKNKKS